MARLASGEYDHIISHIIYHIIVYNHLSSHYRIIYGDTIRQSVILKILKRPAIPLGCWGLSVQTLGASLYSHSWSCSITHISRSQHHTITITISHTNNLRPTIPYLPFCPTFRSGKGRAQREQHHVSTSFPNPYKPYKSSIIMYPTPSPFPSHNTLTLTYENFNDNLHNFTGWRLFAPCPRMDERRKRQGAGQVLRLVGYASRRMARAVTSPHPQESRGR